jgi:hypothetical protein
MTITKEHDEVLDKIRGILGEHFHSWAFVVLEEEGNMYYDYTNRIVGESLLVNAMRDMMQPNVFENAIFEEGENE